jgi:3-isopropylmalate/(R)-2-methylmalate dehydratase large subunit
MTALFDRIWSAHELPASTPDAPTALYIDLLLLHEITANEAFAELRARGLPVRRPGRVIATMDHAIPTLPHAADDGRPASRRLLQLLDDQQGTKLDQYALDCAEFGIELLALGDDRQGIVHVIGPELGLTCPGRTIVCGDSHTTTHGALGALAFGVGTSQVGHVLATQSLLLERPGSLVVEVTGRLGRGVAAKDLALAIVHRLGVSGGRGRVIEFRGAGIRALSIEERMTICNMSIEAGARAGMVAPDDTTFEYLHGRPFAPKDAAWDAAVAEWRALAQPDDQDREPDLVVDASSLEPMVTYGTNPAMAVAIGGFVPDPALAEAAAGQQLRRALSYMQLVPGQPIAGTHVDVVFIGSCTNARLSDLRLAADIMRGRRVADGVRMLVVPGSRQVKRDAEAEGLDEIFRAAGAEWRQPGCSMCIAMNGDRLEPGQLAVSTSNRNFEGRQGTLGRTILASPQTAAASALAGHVADPRTFLEGM